MATAKVLDSGALLCYFEQEPGFKKVLKNLRENEECWTLGFKPEELSGYLARFHLVLLEDLGAAEYRDRHMPDRKEISKGYEFYGIAFTTQQK